MIPPVLESTRAADPRLRSVVAAARPKSHSATEPTASWDSKPPKPPSRKPKPRSSPRRACKAVSDICGHVRFSPAIPSVVRFPTRRKDTDTDAYSPFRQHGAEEVQMGTARYGRIL